MSRSPSPPRWSVPSFALIRSWTCCASTNSWKARIGSPNTAAPKIPINSNISTPTPRITASSMPRNIPQHSSSPAMATPALRLCTPAKWPRAFKPPTVRITPSCSFTIPSPATPAAALSTRPLRSSPTGLAFSSGSLVFPQTEPHRKIEVRETAFLRVPNPKFLACGEIILEGLGLGFSLLPGHRPTSSFCPSVQYLRRKPSCKLTPGLHCSRYAGKHVQNAQFQPRVPGTLAGRLRCNDHRQSAATSAASFQLQLPVTRPRRQSWRLRTVSRRQSLERRYFFHASG